MCYFMQTSAAVSSAISALCDGGGDACTMATTALLSNTACASATDANTICTGMCRDLYNDIIDNCDATVSGYDNIATGGFINIASYIGLHYSE